MQQLPKEAREIAALGAMTVAIKAQRALGAVGITAEVIALSPSQTRRGCAYGVAYPLSQKESARRALRRERISASEYLGEHYDLS